MVGLTATVGIGNSKDLFGAKEHILSLCARLGLANLPTEVVEYKEELEDIQDPPMEGSTFK